MPSPFCHLHNHTEYSLLDGANRIPDMVRRAAELEMGSLAITDHGVMFGAVEFYFACREAGIRPVLGVEAYVAPSGMLKRGGREENENFHLLLLAKDREGYQNLCKLCTIAALEGYYYKPRVDHDVLREHARGLVATTTCLGSEVDQALLRGEYERAQYIAGMYAEMFGADNYYVELQDHRLPEQAAIRDGLLRIARDLKLPLLATNDAHYLCRTDAAPHDVLLCIQTGASVDDEKRLRFQTDEFYLKAPEEMAALFADVPEALENTTLLAERCEVELEKLRPPMPQPDVPEGMTSESYLRAAAEAGLNARMKHPEASLERLNFELDVIGRTGFQDYFLLVKEFAEATRERGIYFGVRGSAAGSLVSYCLGITDVDPVEYDLTFERFLNPERISMPDIDMDFEDARRDEIIQYVGERFGRDRVAQIITFGTLGAKAAIRDCARVKGYAPQEADRLCKTIPSAPNWTIDRAMKEVAEFRDLVKGDPRLQSLVELARSVEGISRHAGVHAAGIVIARDPLSEYVPLYRGNDGQPVTAYEMGILEKLGLLKMDFLGLSNLTVLSRTVRHVRATRGVELDVGNLPEGDEATYAMLARGETIGVFQLESAGMTRYVQQLKPTSVRDLAAMVALYRPGPMEHIPRFIDAKAGRTQPVVLHPAMEPILAETYGVIVYQDQVLKLVQALAGFSLGKADVLRKAMGKKDPEAMAAMRAEFLEGAAAHGVESDVADKVWDLLLPFAGYAFNKAHSVCYAILAYQTAYLKSTYTVEYMAAQLGVYRAKEDRVVACIEECRRLRVPVLPPDVNASLLDFNIEEKSAIRFGLAAIKGIGAGLAQAIIDEREAAGPFGHLFEFAERLKPCGLNRSSLEALVKAGAFDSVDRNRRRMLEALDGAMGWAESANRNRLGGQVSLFDDGSAPAASHYPPITLDVPEYSRTEILNLEKEVMGIYVSDHPLRGHEGGLRRAASHACAGIGDMEDGAEVRLAGVIVSLRLLTTRKSGERMATFVLEDFSGQTGVTVFPRTFEKVRDRLTKDSLVTLRGFVSQRERGGERANEVRLDELSSLEPELALAFADVPRHADGPGYVEIHLKAATRQQLERLKGVLGEHPGMFPVHILVAPAGGYPPILADAVDPESLVPALKRIPLAVDVRVERVGA